MGSPVLLLIMITWRLASRIIQLVLVVATFLLARFGRGEKTAMFGFGPEEKLELWHTEALIVGRSRGQFWLSSGLSFYILILTSQLVSQCYHATEDTVKNFLITTSGGVLHLISGWTTLCFYSPLSSTSLSYPRSPGIALAS